MRVLEPIPAITLLLGIALTPIALAPGASAAESLRPRLSGFWDDWLGEVGPLLTLDEREVFRTLDNDEARERFVAAFWESRGAAALERWTRNRDAADRVRPRSTWGRRAMLLFGKPASIERVDACGGLRPLELWRWESWLIERQGGRAGNTEVLVLLQQTRLMPDSFFPWDPSDVEALGYYPSPNADLATYLDGVRPSTCLDGGLRQALSAASSFDELRDVMPWPRPQAPGLVELGSEAGLSEAPRWTPFDVDYTGTHGRHTILHGVLRVRTGRLAELVPGHLFDRVTFVGDIYKRGYLVDSFRVVHHVAGTPPGDVVELDLFRGLRPGRYRLDLRVEDGRGLALLRTRRELQVPKLDTPAPPPPGRQQDYGLLTRSEVVLLDTLPSVELLPVSARAAADTELVAITTGGPIASVAFYVDGRHVGRDSSPPYSLTLQLTDEPHTARAVALDGRNWPLAAHCREIAPQSRPFAVHLERPMDAGEAAPVHLSLPEGTRLAELRCYDGRSLVGTLTAPPFECPVPRRTTGGLRYARALATLSNGDSAEHLLFFGPNAPERLDVQLAEVYLSVVDDSGRPVTGLSQTDFRLVDGGRERRLLRVESLANLPISVALLMDLSSSMGRLARLAAESARMFFEDIMLDDDLASLLAFNDDFHRLVPFTDDIAELRLGATGLRALGSTRLHDGIVWALSQYAGQDNRRALVVLSDGVDVNSDFPLEQVVAAAVEGGVVVYPISIVRRSEEPPARLEELARRTGGSRFVVSSIAELDHAYARVVEELRSQYLLVYGLDGGEAGVGPRSVDVEVRRAGFQAQNIHSHYQ